MSSYGQILCDKNAIKIIEISSEEKFKLKTAFIAMVFVNVFYAPGVKKNANVEKATLEIYIEFSV